MASILREFLIVDPTLDALISEGQVSDDDKSTDVELNLSDLPFSSDLSGVELSCDLIQDILSEHEDSSFLATDSSTILETNSKDSHQLVAPVSPDNSHQLAAPVSPCNSCDTDDVLSLLGQDEGYSSLSDCSASICELLDPSDYSTLLETLAAAISTDSPVVLGDACQNLARCVPDVNQQSCTPTETTAQDYQSQPESRPTDPGHTASKPDVSYIEMIANALMENNNSVVLGDIYTHIMDTYPYYKHTTNSWKTSIRHNLSVNECFVKGKRSKNGYFWSVHASCIESFKNRDFDRRKARRQVQHCNRAFSSALDEMKQLSELSRHSSERSSTGDGSMSRQISTPQYPAHTVGSTSYMPPMSSTPVRAQPCVSKSQQYHNYGQQQQMSYNQHQNSYIQPQNPYNQLQNAYNQSQNAFIPPQNAFNQPQYGHHYHQVYNTGYHGY